jgi:hypothetical protein
MSGGADGTAFLGQVDGAVALLLGGFDERGQLGEEVVVAEVLFGHSVFSSTQCFH